MGITGILSGHGGTVTGLFHQRVSEAVQRKGFGYDEEYPATVTTNIPGGAIDARGEIDLPRFRALLEETLPFFRGTDALLMLCNSFYAHGEEVSSRYEGTLVIVPELVSARIALPENTLVIASRTVREHRLYGDEVTYADSPEVDELIEAGIGSRPGRELIQRLHEDYRGFETVVLGCTDLTRYRNNFEGIFESVIIDSVTVAAEFVVNHQEEKAS